mmetsp:Transcript_34982/g.96755  ORF Transcript_34982/g.96755 Transcript_34982/m.96755 type:complete len:430 (-) Transcript_34982:115-1404(-)
MACCRLAGSSAAALAMRAMLLTMCVQIRGLNLDTTSRANRTHTISNATIDAGVNRLMARPSVTTTKGKAEMHTLVPDDFKQHSFATGKGKRPSAAFKADVFFLVYWGAISTAVVIFIYFRWHTFKPYPVAGEAPEKSKLPVNIWTLNVVAAVRQAKVGEFDMSPVLVGIIAVCLGSIQMFALFLVVHDIDPDADPVTTKSSSPWIKSGWSVNCMKWLMVSFLSAQMVKEAGQCKEMFAATMITNRNRLCVPKCFLFFIASIEYLVLILVVWGGVAVVLSFQAVPDILYSSMAIVFVASVDGAVFEMFHQLFDIKADFTIVHGVVATPKTCFTELDSDGDGYVSMQEWFTAMGRASIQNDPATAAENKNLQGEQISFGADLFFRLLTAFPAFLAFFMISSGFYLHQSPTEEVHEIEKVLSGDIASFLRYS